MPTEIFVFLANTVVFMLAVDLEAAAMVALILVEMLEEKLAEVPCSLSSE